MKIDGPILSATKICRLGAVSFWQCADIRGVSEDMPAKLLKIAVVDNPAVVYAPCPGKLREYRINVIG